MKRPAIFFDRDNTLMVGHEYLGDPARVQLMPGAAAAVARARRLGYATVIVSNQSGVARGFFDEAAVHAVNHRLEQLLTADDPAAVIDRHEFCPFHPAAEVEAYRQDSELRKPKPGMILQAAEMLALDLSRSWLIGDAPRDVDAGAAAGCRTILFTPPGVPASPAAAGDGESTPDFRVDSLEAALDVIEQNADAPRRPPPEPARPPEAAPPAASRAPDEPRPAPPPPADEPPEAPSPSAPPADPALATLNQSPPAIRPARAVDASDTPARPGPGGSAGSSRAEVLLEQILVELRRRDTLAGADADFSVSKLLAGIVQVLAIGLVFVAYLSRETPDRFWALLIFSQFLQTLTIALLIMGRQR